jgi:HK97 family phage major capsid protein
VAYDNLISRSDAAALIPEEVFDGLMGKATAASAALSLFRRIPVSRAQVRMPVLSALPVAYWVDGDTGLKQTTEVNWANKYLNIEEIACIVPVPENVLDDADYNIWGEAEPLIAEAIARTLDAAVFFGTNAPASFPDDVNTAATAASNTNAEGNAATAGSFFGDLDEALLTLEADGFDASGWVMARSAKGRFRAARSSTGELLDRERVSAKLDEFDGNPVVYPMRGLFAAGVRGFVGDWTQYVIGVRKDVTIKILDQAVIQDNNGDIVYNLAQQDMVAARVTFRAGWQVANTINHDQSVEASRYPAAVLTFTP